MKSGVARLGYLGHTVADMAAIDTIFGDVLGMQRREVAGSQEVMYRMDGRHHRFVFSPAKSDQLSFIGWETDSLQSLHAVVERLKNSGKEVTKASPDLCLLRSVFEMYRCTGPDGVPLEIFFGGVDDPTVFRSTQVSDGFLTGKQGLGHMVLGTANVDASAAFYCDLFGFEISDYVHWDIARVTFMHCNPRHHSLAVMNPVYGTEAGAMNHVMVQAKTMDDVGRAYDRVRELGVPLVLTLGKHSNDHMTSFYMHTPGGWAIEFGYGALEIDEEWDVRFYDSPRLWGHSLKKPAAPLL